MENQKILDNIDKLLDGNTEDRVIAFYLIDTLPKNTIIDPQYKHCIYMRSQIGYNHSVERTQNRKKLKKYYNE